jgi:uncharacterized alkaline shock family protein YloU
VSDTGGSDPAARGRLDIAPTVLRKIVEHAADGTPGTLRHERRVAGIDIGTAGAGAKVTDGPDGVVDVALELTLQYPAPVRRTVDAVRSRVAGELERIAGRRVRNLAVTVSGLRGADDGTAAGPRVQ